MSDSYKTPPDRKLVRLQRPHDFLYDPNFIQPNREDFMKNASIGTKAGARVTLRPVWKSFFSDVYKDNRLEPCLTIPQPSNIENFVPQNGISCVPTIPMDTGPLPLPPDDDVTGMDRAKYAIRYAEKTYYVSRETFDFKKLSHDEKQKLLLPKGEHKPGYVSRGVQTDTRESETQTDPYSPPYKLPYPGANPKVLALTKLTWGKGLPFTLDDIVVIETALAKRSMDAIDRNAEDPKSFEKRIKLIENLEAQQWANRERELDKLFRLKLEMTERLLLEYTGSMVTEHTQRLERLQNILLVENAKHLENVKHQYFRCLRKLERKYFIGTPSRKRNIIRDYTEFDSQIYAPLVRNGLSMDALNPVPDFELDIHRDLEALRQLTMSKSFIQKEVTFDMCAFKLKIKNCGLSKYDQRMDRKLEKIYDAFNEWKPQRRTNYDKWDRISATDSATRLSTPIISLEADKEEGRRRHHVVNLQKICRGRVIQQLIRNEMDVCMDELLGLKKMFDMDPNGFRMEEGQLQKLQAMKKKNDAEGLRDPEVKEVLGHLEGETLNKMLDFLDKEMIRLIDERKVHALILMAERERRKKEAIEGGRRFFEEETRRINDEAFRQVAGINQATVDLYLEDIFMEACDRSADETSRNHIRLMAQTLNEAAYALRGEMGEFEKEELAADIVSSYIIPELSRHFTKEKLEAAGSRYKKAAAQVLDSLFAAQQMLKEVFKGPVPPLVREGIMKGWPAADGSLQMVDGLIHQTVELLLQAKEDAIAQEAASREEARKAAELAGSSGEEKPQVPLNRLPSDAIITKQTGSVMDMLAIEAAEKANKSKEPSSEEPDELYYEDPEVVADDRFRRRIAAKALQVDLDMEPGQHIERMYAAIKGLVDSIIVTGRRSVVPDPPRSRENDERDEDSDNDD